MTLELPRRKFLIGLASLIVAPAIVRVESLMPVSNRIIAPVILEPNLNSLLSIREITIEAIKLFKNSNIFLEKIDREYDARFYVRLNQRAIHLRP
jgi:hypothetical protein